MNANRIFLLFVLLYLICSFYGLVEVPLGGDEPRQAYLAVEGMTTKDPLIMRHAFVLIGIKFLMIYGILSEPLQRERRTRDISAYIYEICNQERVYMTGELEPKELSLQLGPYSWDKIKHKPPLIAYQIPLYYYEKLGTTISYSAKLNGVGCNIKKVSKAQEHLGPSEGPKNQFVDPWTNSVFEIVRKESVSNEDSYK